MDLLGRFRKLDSSLQRGLDNGLARVFGGAVVPAEIEELLKQEAENALLHDEHHATIAPDYFVVLLSVKDLQSLTENSPQLADQLAGRLNRFLRNEGWQTRERAHVELRSDEGLHTGQLRCHTSFGAPVSADHTVPDPDAHEGEQNYSAGASGWQQPSAQHNQQQDHPSPVPQFGGYNQKDDSDSQQAPAAHYEASQFEASQYESHDASEEPTPPTMDPNPSTPTVSAPHIPSTMNGPDTDQPWEQRDSSHAHTSGNDYSASGTYEGASTTRPAVSLLLQDGSSRVYHVSDGETVIGRSAQADFRLPDTGVSRQHAKIVWDGDDIVLVDLDSTNGTFVNDVEIKDWLLDDGDVINLGHSDIEVRIIKHDSAADS